MYEIDDLALRADLLKVSRLETAAATEEAVEEISRGFRAVASEFFLLSIYQEADPKGELYGETVSYRNAEPYLYLSSLGS